MKKVIMVILDGIGIKDTEIGNAIKQSDMDCFNQLYNEYPHAVLQASGEYIGLLDGQSGNSDVGHLTIGAGKKLKQEINICNEFLGNPELESNEKLINFLNNIKEKKGSLHLIGMVSDGCVHSDIKYMKNFLGHLKKMSIVDNAYFHAITDGVDTPSNTSANYIRDLEETMQSISFGEIADVCGRFYAMDRDNKWNHIKLYTDMLIRGKAAKVKSYESAIAACYKENINDEKIPPFILKEEARIKENDGIIWLNFRSDRSREVLTALKNPEFAEYNTYVPNNINVMSLLEVPNTKNIEVLIDNPEEIYSLGTYFSELGLTQARIAETEKYQHVTTTFNGGKISKLKYCDNFLIASPAVESYEMTPEMSAEEVTKQTIKCLEKDYDFILVNFANPDILGHTGNIEATKSALKIIDKCLDEIVTAVDNNFYHLIVTSSHSNCEEMVSKDEITLTTNSTSPVPFIIRDKKVNIKHKGDITQIAPTILKYMDIAIPKSMEGTKPLFIEEE